jgi:hypothetical protein
MTPDELKTAFGQRIQRCYGCFVAFYLKDMWLAADATYYCKDCKGESMFHFDEYIDKLDLSKISGTRSEE